MSKKSQFTHRPLTLERLEARLPLAGDVAISIKSGSLTVTGDDAVNWITISQTVPGAFTISGNAGETFKQKGQPDTQNPVDVANITKDIKVYLKGGADSLVVNGHDIGDALARNLTIQTGGGADNVNMHNAKLTGKLSLDSGKKGDADADGDLVHFGLFDVAKQTNIFTGRGHDVIEIHECIFQGNLTVNTGKATGGGDSIDISDTQANGKSVTLITNDGDDHISMRNVAANTLAIKSNAGQDTLNLDAVALDRVTLLMSKGNDVLNLNGPLTLNGPKKSKILGGGDNDIVNGKSKMTAGSELFLADPELDNSGWEQVNA